MSATITIGKTPGTALNGQQTDVLTINGKRMLVVEALEYGPGDREQFRGTVELTTDLRDGRTYTRLAESVDGGDLRYVRFIYCS